MRPAWPANDEDCTSTTLSDLAWNVNMVLLVIALTASGEQLTTLSLVMPRLETRATTAFDSANTCRVVVSAAGEVHVDDLSLGVISDEAVQAALEQRMAQRMQAAPKLRTQMVTDERTTAQSLLLTTEVVRRHCSQIDFVAQRSKPN